jgi:hypothetical protein
MKQFHSFESLQLLQNGPHPGSGLGVLPSLHHFVSPSQNIPKLNSSAAAAVSSKKRRIAESPSPPNDFASMLPSDLDPESREGKKEQRRIRNRMSAMMHRERKKQYIETLEDEVREKDRVISRLQHDLHQALEANKELQRKLLHSAPPSAATASAAVATTGHALSHQEFLGALARPHPTYPSATQPEPHPVPALPLLLKRGRAGTTVTSNEGSGSDSECSVSDLTQMWRGDPTASGLDSDELDEGLRENWCGYLSPATSLTTPTPASLTPSPRSLTPSLTPSPPMSPSSRQRSVPLYSFVLLLSGFSFFSGLFALSPSFSLDELLPPFHLSSTFTLDSIQRGSHHLPVKTGGGGRVLLSLPAFADEENETTNSFASQLAPVIWTHPSHVTSIYPYPLAPISLSSPRFDSQKKRRYLRSEENSTDASDPSDADGLTELTRVYTTKELALFYENTWPSSAASMSKIYLTEGKVLLDPSLVAAASLPSQPQSVDDASSLSKAIIPSWHFTSPRGHSSPEEGASTSSSVPYTEIRPSAASSSPHQMLTMIVPATTVQWGGSSWIDGDSPHTSQNILQLLMRNMNLTAYATENGLFDEDNNVDISGLSVEIACHVLKARIVKDVVVVSEA